MSDLCVLVSTAIGMQYCIQYYSEIEFETVSRKKVFYRTQIDMSRSAMCSYSQTACSVSAMNYIRTELTAVLVI